MDRKETAMSSEAGRAQANVALVVESVEAFNAGDTERLLSVMAPDFVMHLAEFPEPLGRDAWREGFKLVRRAFPDLEAQIDDLVADDDKVALRLTLYGTHRGEFQDIPPPNARSATSATSSTASETACSPKSESAPTWHPSSAS
jgi:steroid delta-isomerase-like uncharacterized protein